MEEEPPVDAQGNEEDPRLKSLFCLLEMNEKEPNKNDSLLIRETRVQDGPQVDFRQTEFKEPSEDRLDTYISI